MPVSLSTSTSSRFGYGAPTPLLPCSGNSVKRTQKQGIMSPGIGDGLKRMFSRKDSNPISRRDSTEQSASKRQTSRGSFLSPQGSSNNNNNNNNPFSLSSPATRRPNRSGMNAFSTPSNEPPPAYTPGPANLQQTVIAAPNTASAADDPYDFLKDFDTIFLIDDSGSMAGRSWRETSEALKTIAPICTKYDSDGIDIYFLNHPDSSIYKNVTSASTVQEIFQTVRPGGGTPTGRRLEVLLQSYYRRYKANPDITKPINIIVITDGEPSDDDEAPIIKIAKQLDNFKREGAPSDEDPEPAPAWQVGIQFFQVGNEPGARQHLKDLDDLLKEVSGDKDLRDIVDTVPFTGENGGELTATGVMKVVLGSVNRRLDRKSMDCHR